MGAITVRTRRRAEAARQRAERMRREITQWKGEPPTELRMYLPDVMAMTEVGYVRDGILSGTGIKVIPVAG